MNFFTDEKSKLLSDMGMKCCMEGDFEKGLKYFNTGLELDEDNVLLLYNKAGCLMSMNEAEKAEPIFKKVVRLCEEMGKSEFSLQTKANSYLFMQDYENARVVLDDLLKIAPDNLEALINVAQILNNNLQYNEALVYLDKALKIDPQNTEALMFKGENLYYLFRYDEAKENIDMAFDISSDNAYIWYMKGKLESHFENYDKAVEYYTQAIDMDSDFEKCYYDLAVSLMILGRSEEAKEAFGKIFDMHPEKYDERKKEFCEQIVDIISYSRSLKMSE